MHGKHTVSEHEKPSFPLKNKLGFRRLISKKHGFSDIGRLFSRVWLLLVGTWSPDGCVSAIDGNLRQSGFVLRVSWRMGRDGR